MKTAIAIAAAGLMSLGNANIALAARFHLEPPGSFKGDGKTSATKNGISLPCIAHFTGRVTNAGVGYVTGGTFTDNGSLGCTSVKLTNLPWKSLAVASNKAKIFNVTFTSPIGNCGPGTVPVTVRNGAIRFTAVPLKGGCSVNGNIVTTPKLSIVKNTE